MAVHSSIVASHRMQSALIWNLSDPYRTILALLELVLALGPSGTNEIFHTSAYK
jgi:hypothetical protein